MSRDLHRGLATLPNVVAAALEAEAGTVAAEVSARLSAENPDAAVTISQADDGVTVAITLPGAAAREFGTRAKPARPFLRPAIAALRHDIGRRIVTTLRRTLPGGHFR